MKDKNYDELELRDDFIFGKVMSNPEICKQTLEVLLGRPIERITYPERQKVIDLTIDGKSVRLDLYVQDEKDTVYNAEMQQTGNCCAGNGYSSNGCAGNGHTGNTELPKRSRYYQGMIDLNLLEKGVSYRQLQESYIIFICTFDPFGENKSKYTFQTVCRENTELILEDKTTKIFLNTKGDGEGISAELKAFLDYVETKQTADAFTEKIDDTVERVKRNQEWRREYMKELLLKHDAELAGYAHGCEVGFAQGREAGLLEGHEAGLLEGHEAGLAQGETLFAALTKKLLSDNRTDDLLKATADIPYRRQLYLEYGLEN